MLVSPSVIVCISTWYMLRHARGRYIVHSLPHRKTSQFIRRCQPYSRKSVSQAVLSSTQLTLHATRRAPHGALRLVLATSAWSVKTRRAPPRQCRDARLYGHTSTTLRDSEYAPVRLLPSFPPPIFRCSVARYCLVGQMEGFAGFPLPAGLGPEFAGQVR